MRIIRGKYKGRKILFNPKLKSRPTTDFAREGLFNILEDLGVLEGENFLDLFCGTGLIGMEAISRGVESLVSVDVDMAVQRSILDVYQKFEGESLRFHRADVFRFLKKDYPIQFKLVFADPPYTFHTMGKLPGLVMNGNWLAPGGFFVLEHGKDKDFSKEPGFHFHRMMGNVNFSFFQKPEA